MPPIQFTSIKDFEPRENGEPVPIEPGLVNALRYLAQSFAEGARLTRLLEGIEGLKTAFQLEDVSMASVEMDGPETADERRLFFMQILENIVAQTHRIEKPELLLMMEWATYWLITGCDLEFLVPEDEPFVVHPPDGDITPEEISTYQSMLVRQAQLEQAKHTCEPVAEITEPFALMQIRLQHLKDDHAQQMGQYAMRMLRISFMHHSTCSAHRDLYVLSDVLGTLAFAFEKKDALIVRQHYASIPPPLRAHADMILRASVAN